MERRQLLAGGLWALSMHGQQAPDPVTQSRSGEPEPPQRGMAAVFNVRDFGAVGDGRTDDTTAIQSAINAVPAANDGGGGAVFFPAGRYCVTDTLALCAGLTVYGVGRGASAIIQGRPSIDTLKPAAGTRRAARDITIRDLHIAGPSKGTEGVAVNLDAGSDAGSSFLIENVAISGHSVGVRMKDALVSALVNVWVNEAGSDAFVSEGTMNAVTFLGTYANACGRHGYRLSGAYCTLVNAASDNNGGDGYRFYGSSSYRTTNLTLISCGSEKNSGCGLFVQLGAEISVNGMYVRRPGADGIRLDGVESALLSQVQVEGGPGWALNMRADTLTRRPCRGIVILGGKLQAGAQGQVSGEGCVLHAEDDRLTLGVPAATVASVESLGQGAASLGSNCPASHPETPWRWLKVLTSDGSTAYVPAWR